MYILYTVHTLFHNCDLLVPWRDSVMLVQPSKRTAFLKFSEKSSTESSFPPGGAGCQARIHPETKTHPPKSRFLPSKWERMKAPGWTLPKMIRWNLKMDRSVAFWKASFSGFNVFWTFPDDLGSCLWNVRTISEMNWINSKHSRYAFILRPSGRPPGENGRWRDWWLCWGKERSGANSRWDVVFNQRHGKIQIKKKTVVNDLK